MIDVTDLERRLAAIEREQAAQRELAEQALSELRQFSQLLDSLRSHPVARRFLR